MQNRYKICPTILFCLQTQNINMQIFAGQSAKMEHAGSNPPESCRSDCTFRREVGSHFLQGDVCMVQCIGRAPMGYVTHETVFLFS